MLIAIAYMGVIFILSSIPGDTYSKIGISALISNIMHIPLFGGLAYLWLRALRNRKVSLNKALIYSIIITIAYAIFDEFHQSFVPGREASLRDIALDTLGCISAVIIWKLVNSQESKDCRP